MTLPLMPSRHRHPAPEGQPQALGRSDRLPLNLCDLDDFEEGLLPILRHFFRTLAEPERQTWQFAYSIAAERWGEASGLPISQAMFKLVQCTAKARGIEFEAIDPLALHERDLVSQDERALLQMLHHMRRDETSRAPAAVANVTGGTMDAEVIRAGLSFAARFPIGGLRPKVGAGRPKLQVVR